MTSTGKRKPRNSRASVISSALGGGGGASAAPTRSQATAQCNGSTRADHARAEEIATDLLARAERVGEPGGRVAGHLITATSNVHLGRPAAAHGHYEQAVALYEAHEQPDLAYRYGLELGITAYAYDAWCLSVMGDQGRAVERAERSL